MKKLVALMNFLILFYASDVYAQTVINPGESLTTAPQALTGDVTNNGTLTFNQPGIFTGSN